MITNLKSAKARLSELVELASQGEEIVITVRGKARAKICAVTSESDRASIEAWGHRLEEIRTRYGAVNAAPSGEQEMWDALREDR